MRCAKRAVCCRCNRSLPFVRPKKTHTHTHSRRYGVDACSGLYTIMPWRKEKEKIQKIIRTGGKIIIKISVAHNESRRVIAIRSPGQLGVFSPYGVDDLSSPGFFFTVIRLLLLLLLVLIVLFPLAPTTR